MISKSTLLGLGLALVAMEARADYVWTDWTSASWGTGAEGTLTVEGNAVGISYSGDVTGADLGFGHNYFRPSGNGSGPAWAAYDAINAPTTPDHIETTYSGLKTITFSQALLNPVMAVISMGAPWSTVSYAFDQSFTILDEGQGYWGSDPDGAQVAGNTLIGTEWHGYIQFNGSVSSISWNSNPDEFWHGFTIGVDERLPAPAAVPEPGTLALMGLGLVGLAAAARRRRA